MKITHPFRRMALRPEAHQVRQNAENARPVVAQTGAMPAGRHNRRKGIMNHLRRLERCMFAGAVVAVLAATLAITQHRALAARAAADHESVRHLVTVAIIGVMLAAGLVTFVVASIIAARRRRRLRAAGREPGLPPRRRDRRYDHGGR